MATEGRLERLQIMLTEEELAAVDDWRFSRRMPSRAASVRELLKRGLSVEGFEIANKSTKSKEFGILTKPKPERSNGPEPTPVSESRPSRK
jgi:hypothetical protein